MDELDLIKGYLLKRGSKIMSACYYNESCLCTATGYTYNFGRVDGVTLGHAFLFGHVNLRAHVAGVINLANQMRLSYTFESYLWNWDEVVLQSGIGVNYGLSLLGNGEYEGNKRIYGIGFSRFNLDAVGFGAATFDVVVNFNGYLFTII
jgi:hypothetical protein